MYVYMYELKPCIFNMGHPLYAQNIVLSSKLDSHVCKYINMYIHTHTHKHTNTHMRQKHISEKALSLPEVHIICTSTQFFQTWYSLAALF